MKTLKQVFSAQGILPPDDIWRCLETDLSHCGGGVEARGAAQHPAVHRTAPPTNNYLAQDVSSTKAEKPSIKEAYRIERENPLQCNLWIIF